MGTIPESGSGGTGHGLKAPKMMPTSFFKSYVVNERSATSIVEYGNKPGVERVVNIDISAVVIFKFLLSGNCARESKHTDKQRKSKKTMAKTQ